ncbi:paraquat-inducible protein A [Spartinivicinus poritis]|uniref:Paraquat-inducible protein A n=1 Tax=Spartinivicinus poritis TaxID=2994640 RepID=A0ABT5U4N7_9GAMM|nr:paraquat-inducible protein A [Spartinivicinus sp. A2-2]MDE1461190.1 paraquat-inducible protein A [Spartinivicinus sp. A2-2]
MSTKPWLTAQQAQLIVCHECHKVCRLNNHHSTVDIRCPRCHSQLHSRYPNSLAKTWALTLTSLILFIPANTYPITKIAFFGNGQADTIMSGVIALAKAGMIPIAAVVFIASIAVPFLKLLGLTVLLLSVQFKWALSPHQRTLMYRMIEWIGRWSMLDLFVIATLVALVRMGNLATIEAGVGAGAFGGVVVMTMFAAMTFDPRLIWDNASPTNGGCRKS